MQRRHIDCSLIDTFQLGREVHCGAFSGHGIDMIRTMLASDTNLSKLDGDIPSTSADVYVVLGRLE